MQKRTPAHTVRAFDVERLDARALVDAKRGQRVSVCLPARNEEATVGAIVETIRTDLVDLLGLVDEVVVVDDHSSDATAAIAASAGARVVDASKVLREHGHGHGKGEAMWKSLYEANGDLIVWCDADIRDFDSRFVVGLVGPLLLHPELQFVKGFYERPVNGPAGGGRVTELVARPLLSMFFPELTGVVQPLAGEYAMRRSLAERLPFIVGYGVDVGILIDTFRSRGIERAGAGGSRRSPTSQPITRPARPASARGDPGNPGPSRCVAVGRSDPAASRARAGHGDGGRAPAADRRHRVSRVRLNVARGRTPTQQALDVGSAAGVGHLGRG